jgi:hypothetical protein
MAPEQAGGKIDTLGPATDTYALGAILYHMLTGRPPFQASTQLDTIMQVLTEEPVAPRKLNPAITVDLETICLKCLEKPPKRRYDSCQHLATDLTAWLEHQPIAARPIGIAGKLQRWRKRNPVVANLSAGLFVLLILCTILSLTFALQAERETEIAQKAMIRATTSQNIAITAKLRAETSVAAEKVQRKNAEASLIRAENAEIKALHSEQEARKLAAEAIAARKKSEELRLRAEEISAQERRRAYHGDILLAKRAWDTGNMSNLNERLYRYSKDKNLKGIEWNYL